MGAGGALGTDGFIQEAPWQRGPVDINSNVHAQNGLLLVEHDRGPLRLFARGNGFNEARANGTPYQINGTRLWRYATGARLAGTARRSCSRFGSMARLNTTGRRFRAFPICPSSAIRPARIDAAKFRRALP